jgi:hypothetical protein
MAQTRRMGKLNPKGGPIKSAEVFALPNYVPFLAGLAFLLPKFTRMGSWRIAAEHNAVCRLSAKPADLSSIALAKEEAWKGGLAVRGLPMYGPPDLVQVAHNPVSFQQFPEFTRPVFSIAECTSRKSLLQCHEIPGR